jgi:hypothetical protein
MVKKILGIDPGRGQEDLKGLTSFYLHEFYVSYKNLCVRVCVRVCVCVN